MQFVACLFMTNPPEPVSATEGGIQGEHGSIQERERLIGRGRPSGLDPDDMGALNLPPVRCSSCAILLFTCDHERV